MAAYLIGPVGPTVVSNDITIATAAGIEIFITFMLMASILLIVSRTENLFAIASLVGLTVAVLAFIFGRFTGASMNPARTLDRI